MLSPLAVLLSALKPATGFNFPITPLTDPTPFFHSPSRSWLRQDRRGDRAECYSLGSPLPVGLGGFFSVKPAICASASRKPAPAESSPGR